MKLYYFPDACSLAPHIALREIRQAFTLMKVDYHTRTLEDGSDYRAINPKGSVPALQLDSGEQLTEVSVILQYIAAQSSDSFLMPSSSDQRFRCLEWLNYIATELHKSASPLYRASTPRCFMAPGRKHLMSRFDLVETRLRVHDYLVAGEYTMPDIYLYTVTRWLSSLDIDTSRWPGLGRHHSRISQRAAVQAALVAEGLT